MKCFVINGFDSWNTATNRFKKHEKSEFHVNSVQTIYVLRNAKPVNQLLSDSKRMAFRLNIADVRSE